MKKIFLPLLLLTTTAMLAECACKKKQAPPPPPAAPVRTPDHPITLWLVERNSPRAMSGEAISEQELNMMLEGARWAPSSYNEQPWHFLYATRDDPYWNDFLSLLDEGNKVWAHKAGVLILILSRNLYERNAKENTTHSFDTGAAWMQLALQGHMMGLAVHGMCGFDYTRAREELRIPDCYTIEAMVAVGRKGNKDELPENLRSLEVLSLRKKITEFTTHGPYLTC